MARVSRPFFRHPPPLPSQDRRHPLFRLISRSLAERTKKKPTAQTAVGSEV